MVRLVKLVLIIGIVALAAAYSTQIKIGSRTLQQWTLMVFESSSLKASRKKFRLAIKHALREENTVNVPSKMAAEVGERARQLVQNNSFQTKLTEEVAPTDQHSDRDRRAVDEIIQRAMSRPQ